MAISTEHDFYIPKAIDVLRDLATPNPYKERWSDVMNAELRWMTRPRDNAPAPIPVPGIISGWFDFDLRRSQSIIFLNMDMQPQPFRRNYISISKLDAIPKSWYRKVWTLTLYNFAEPDERSGGLILRTWYQQEGFHYD